MEVLGRGAVEGLGDLHAGRSHALPDTEQRRGRVTIDERTHVKRVLLPAHGMQWYT